MPVSNNLVSIDEAFGASREKVKNWYQSYLNPDFDLTLELVGFDEIYEEAEGINVYLKGQPYLDFLGGYGSVSLGHNHPEILKAVEKVNGRPNILQASLSPLAAALAKNLSEITPGKLQRTFLCNSGAEAVEGALKIARAATGKERIIYTQNSFHGKTLGALSVTGKEKYKTLFKPLLPGLEEIPFGDSASLREKLRKNGYAAFIVEPIQGEGGVILPPQGYLKEVEEICREYETLLILDEVQTGLGRTGEMFACEHEGVKPDILCLAKALSGALVPIGAVVTTDLVWKKAFGGLEKCLLHTSTFGGNSYACASALATIDLLCRDGGKIITETKSKGGLFLSQLKKLEEEHEVIKEVRGKGLMIGVEFSQPQLLPSKIKSLLKEYFASLVVSDLKNEFKIITAYTLNNPNVIRLQPPLLVTEKHLDYVVQALDALCQRGYTKALVGEGLKAGRRFLNRIFR